MTFSMVVVIQEYPLYVLCHIFLGVLFCIYLRVVNMRCDSINSFDISFDSIVVLPNVDSLSTYDFQGSVSLYS